MNSQEFFKMLIGEPPLEVELEIEMKCREVEELPESIMKAYSFACFGKRKPNARTSYYGSHATYY